MAKPVYATAVVERVISEPRAAVWGSLVVETDDQHTGDARWQAAGREWVVETISLEPPWRLVHQFRAADGDVDVGADLVQVTAVLIDQGEQTLAMWSVLVGPDRAGDAELADRLRDALAERLDGIAAAAEQRPRMDSEAAP